jgi:hypothetical protein
LSSFVGGTLIVDDLHIYTYDLLARVMDSDPGWDMELITTRVAIGVNTANTVDREFTEQSFVTARSKPNSIMANPLYFARLTARTFQEEGARVIAKKVFARLTS